MPLSFHLIYFLVLLYHTCTKRHERKSCLFKELLSKWNSNNRNASLYILPKSKSKLKILNLNKLLLSGKNRNYKKAKGTVLSLHLIRFLQCSASSRVLVYSGSQAVLPFVIFAHCLQLVFLFLTKRNYILRMTSHKKLLFDK